MTPINTPAAATPLREGKLRHLFFFFWKYWFSTLFT